jgi:SAM-dependent methyltransferase
MNVKRFKDTYKLCKPIINEIINKVTSEPSSEAIRYCKHINKMGAIIQYAYYVSIVREYIDNINATLLDWGGQYGHVTKLMELFYPKTICYLPNESEYFADYWHKKLLINNVVYGRAPNDYHSINLPDSHVDVILSSGVLEHTREHGVAESEALSELYRVLKDDGMLFIWNFPYKYGSVEILNHLLGRWHHERRYTKKEIVILLEDAGFDIIYFDHHELLNMFLRNMIGKIIGYDNIFIFDYYISKLPILKLVAQHFTIVARKKTNYDYRH